MSRISYYGGEDGEVGGWERTFERAQDLDSLKQRFSGKNISGRSQELSCHFVALKQGPSKHLKCDLKESSKYDPRPSEEEKGKHALKIVKNYFLAFETLSKELSDRLVRVSKNTHEKIRFDMNFKRIEEEKGQGLR